MRARASGRKPDLVDRAALALRLGVGSTTMSRWQRRMILPEPDYRFGSLDLWLWDTVTGWARDKSRFRKRTGPVPDLVDLSELAGRLAVDARAAEAWQRNGLLPEPDYRFGPHDLWLWDTIEHWRHTRAAGPLQELPPVPAPPRRRSQGPRPVGPDEDPAQAGAVETEPPRPSDPVHELDRIQRYFGAMAEELSGTDPG